MTNAKAERIIERVGQHVREEMLRRFRSDCCIGTARAVSRVLDRFGIEARPLAVTLVVFNKRFVEECERGEPPPMQDRIRFLAWCALTGAYSVGTAPGGVPETRGFNGHVIVYAPQVKTIIDGSIENCNRPERGIVLRAALALRLGNRESNFFLRLPVMFPVNGCVVVYKLIDDDAWRRAPDWQDAAHTDEIVRNLVRAAKG